MKNAITETKVDNYKPIEEGVIITNIDEMNAHILKEYPFESCGYIKDGIFIPVKNESPNPVTSFVFSKEVSIELDGFRIEAIIHSHTMRSYFGDPRLPTKLDMHNQEVWKVPWGIVHCDGNTVSELLWFGPPSTKELLGRSYMCNLLDCYTIVRDYYWQKLKIVLPIYPREQHWVDNEPNLLDKSWEGHGFRKLEPNEVLIEHDIILFSIGSYFPNHLGVYLGEEKFLHHLLQRESNVDTLGRWKKFITRILRQEQVKFNKKGEKT